MVIPLRRTLVADETELLGINTRVELATADRILRQRKTESLMLSGVTIEKPETVTIDQDVEVGQDTVIEAHVELRGATKIGAECRIGAGSVFRDCEIADGARILPYVVAERTKIGQAAWVGPFSRLRQNAVVGDHCHIGNYVELKNTTMEHRSKANHLAYLGDAFIGEATNVGAGTITCNYDGVHKHPTRIEDHVFRGKQLYAGGSTDGWKRRVHRRGLGNHCERCSRCPRRRPRPSGRRQAWLGQTAPRAAKEELVLRRG